MADTSRMIVTYAKGVTGFIIQDVGGKCVFRVYDVDHNFVDYDLHHCDLQVTVTDEDAVFYKRGQSRSLDYSPQTLGINVNCSYQEHKGDK